MWATIEKGTNMAVANLKFTKVVSCYSTPGGTPTSTVSKIGQTWAPQEAKMAGGKWYLRGASGWWEAEANASVYNGNPVVNCPAWDSPKNPYTTEACIFVPTAMNGLLTVNEYCAVMRFLTSQGVMQ